MKAKRVLCMLAAILLVVAMMLMFLTGCNRQIIDTTFSFYFEKRASAHFLLET